MNRNYDRSELIHEEDNRNYSIPDDACSDSGKETEHSDDNSISVTVQEIDYSLPTELTDNLFDYRVQIGEDILVVPMTLRHLKEAGWTSDETKYPTLVGGSDCAIDFKKDNELTTIHVRNNNENQQDRLTDEGAAHLTVESAFCNANPALNTKPIVLPKGITSGVSKAEDVVAAYGEPQEIEEQYGAMGGSLCGYVYAYYEGEKLDSYKDADRYVAISIGYYGDKVKKSDWTVTSVQLHYTTPWDAPAISEDSKEVKNVSYADQNDVDYGK